MGDENPIRALGDYSKPSHEGYKNTIELLEGNNGMPLRSEAIRLVLNGCLFHRLWSEDPNQHFKDFLKLVDSLDLDVANRERTRLPWTRFKDLLQKVPHHGIDLWIRVQIFYDHVNPVTRRDIDQSAGGKLRDRNVEESWALLEDLALYDNESWNDPRDFAKPVKVISLTQNVPSTSDRRLIELKNQVQHLMEAYLSPKQPVQVNKITSSCEIYSGPHDTQYCMENPKKSFIEYASLRNNEVGDKQFTTNLGPKNFREDKVREEENVKPNATEYNDHEKTAKAEEKVEEESEDEFEEEIKEEKEEEEDDVDYFDTFHSLEDLRYHEWLLKYPKPSWVNAKIKTESVNNVKFSCMIGHFVKKQASIDLESPVNVMSRLYYNWIMSDTTSIIDHDLGAVVFGKPFVERTGLLYDKKEGTVKFKNNNEKLIFQIPHKMEIFKNVDFKGVNTDMIPPFIIGGNDDDNEKTHYSDSLTLGTEYKYDESVCKAIRSLIRMKNMRKNKEEVT
uniref:MAK10-like protein n=1 Tax=Tanacetum cinerariifolium TaxID=118510 RepID=A0A699GZ06_TANCI|nr:MAK10-like protein [Tanacetum cinerariifolium]